jgi:hypothetical protein
MIDIDDDGDTVLIVTEQNSMVITYKEADKLISLLQAMFQENEYKRELN